MIAPAEIARIVEKLRRASAGLYTENPHDYIARGISAGDALEAADHIEALEDENRDLRVDIEIKRKHLEDADAELAWVDKLVAGLRDALHALTLVTERDGLMDDEAEYDQSARNALAAWEAR